MRVYVKNQRNQPLMPTTPRKARTLLKQGQAKVLTLKPFTIQLLTATGESKQEITLGIDSGYLNIGFSATTEKEEVISGEVKLLHGMSNRITEKSQYRRIRRQRSRYRKPRFDNRKRSDGWLAPSIKHKLDSHVRFVNKIQTILPVSRVIVEVANFDIQKIKNPEISGTEYQQGEKTGFWNVREYILHRDDHKCQNPNCKNKDNNPVLQIHHIKYQSNGGTDAPRNLITLCNQCHTTENHEEGNFLFDWQLKNFKVKTFKDATFMSTVRWKLVDILGCHYTYGFETKTKRIDNKIEKSHANDAFIISGGTKNHKRTEPIIFEQVKRNNRSLEKFYDAKYIDLKTGKKTSASELNCGRRTRNKNKNGDNLRIFRGQKISDGQRRIRTERYFYQPNDLVRYEDKLYTVKGTQNNGEYVALKETKKVVKVGLLKPYKFRKGFVC